MSKKNYSALPIETDLKQDIDRFIDRLSPKPRSYHELVSIMFEKLVSDYRKIGIIALQRPEPEKEPEKVSA